MEEFKNILSNKILPWIPLLHESQPTPWLRLMNAMILFFILQFKRIRNHPMTQRLIKMSNNRHLNLPHLLKFIISQPSLLKFLRSMPITRLNRINLCALTWNFSLMRAIIRRLGDISTEKILEKLQSSWLSFQLMMIIFSKSLFQTKPKLYSCK